MMDAQTSACDLEWLEYAMQLRRTRRDSAEFGRTFVASYAVGVREKDAEIRYED
jgi:hypothetical protein